MSTVNRLGKFIIAGSLTALALSLGGMERSVLNAQSIVLKNAREAPIPIAIQGFVKDGVSGEASDLEAMLTADLIFSRIFKVIPAEAFLEQKITGPLNVLQVDSWRQVGASYVVRAKVSKKGGSPVLDGLVFDVLTGKLVHQKSYTTKRKDIEILSHQFGDDIVRIVTGQDGLFSTKIAFAYQPPGSRFKEVWMMDFNGRNAVPLVKNSRTNLSPEWTHDGKAILYTSSSNIHWNIWRTDLKGKSSQVTSVKGSALGPSVIPGGKEFVVSLSKDGDPEIYLMGMDGSVKKRLTKSRGIDIAPNVSADGKKLCFASDRLGNLHVFTINLEDTEAPPQRLTRVGTLNDSCAWNPTENLMLFSGMDTDREFDIFAMDQSGNNMERLTYDAKNNEAPAWSPDGKLITFASRRSGRNQIYVMKADGTQVGTIVDLPGDASQPTWSPRLGY